jgi:putative lipase involved disintegration of autophagic bodies
MNSIRIVNQFVAGGESFTDNRTLTAKGMEVRRVELAAAKAGSLTTRTSNTVGEITALAGHGIVTGDVIDVYWTGGSRRGVTVGTVATNALPITGGSGDNLPVASTSVTFSKRETDDFGFDGDDVAGIVVYCQKGSTVVFALSGGTEAFARVLGDGGVYTWYPGNGTANPLAGAAVANLLLSQASTLAAQTVYVGVLLN